MTEPLAPQYNPAAFEKDIYASWLALGGFAPGTGSAPPYVIMMPPPNVTAVLHMGHGLNNTVQDVLARFERMRGRPTLWLPGTDHAGIATQNVVEKLVAAEGRTRFDLGREAFVQRVWSFVDQTGDTILEQLRALGSSADWSRTYFTLDEDLTRAVREVFVRLHEKGLIYRGKYIINWCPRCLTALSNEEAEKEETDGRLWWIRYPLAAGSGHVTVATTRPETMLGDSAVVVHPRDKRYAGMVGTMLSLPLAGRKIPILTDRAIDPEFGSGAVKVTPAHDPLDFEIGHRHDLPVRDVMTDDARMNDTVPERFRGLDRFEARKRIVRELEDLGLLEKVENHRHAVGHCYRCETVIEPRLSDQWFVRMKPLAAPALKAHTDGRLRFIPERRGDEYANWMEGIRDWCISRQLWWGHRIPVWYCDSCGKTHVSRTDLVSCPCGAPLRQDPDVLDTWFSSWLVPFSSLGWPEQTEDLKRYYPGSVLVTAPEILFFWVARMVMAGCEFMQAIPFHTVYLHGTVRDTQHRKMSKSLGNGIDPLEVVEKYGADALRFTVVSGMSVGTDVILDPADLETSFAPGRNFANKLWNVGRFILGNLGDSATRPLAGPYPDVVKRKELGLADRWIIARCDRMVREATGHYEKFRLNEAASVVYHFIWSDLADWYLEQAKPRLYGSEPGAEVARAALARTFEVALAVLHPIMPFITEALWRRMPGRADRETLMLAEWPRPDGRAHDEYAERHFAQLQELVGAIRQIRAEYGVEPARSVNVRVARRNPALLVEEATVCRLAKVEQLSYGPPPDEPGGHAVLRDGNAVFIALGELVDLKKECERLQKECDRLNGLIESQHKKLDNAQFTARAPAEVVERERQKLADWTGQHQALRQKVGALGC